MAGGPEDDHGGQAAGRLGRRSHRGGRNGRWGTAIRVPGLAALNRGGGVTEVLTVSCASAGNCAAGGYYFDRPDHHTWFVAVERNGRWGTAIQVPGLKTLNKGTDGVDINGEISVSCVPAGACAAGGYYTDASDRGQGFVTGGWHPLGARSP